MPIFLRGCLLDGAGCETIHARCAVGAGAGTVVGRRDGMLMTGLHRRETLFVGLVGKGLFHPLAATGSPYRSAARVGRPTVSPNDRLRHARWVPCDLGWGSMDGSTLESPFSAHLLVQSQVFEVIAGSNQLAGPVHDLARQFGVEPDDFMSCLDGPVCAGWVTVKTECATLLRIQLAI